MLLTLAITKNRTQVVGNELTELHHHGAHSFVDAVVIITGDLTSDGTNISATSPLHFKDTYPSGTVQQP